MQIASSHLFLRHYEDSHVTRELPLDPSSLKVNDAPEERLSDGGRATRYDFRHQSDEVLGAAGVTLDFEIGDWDSSVFLLLPAAAYAANRFEAHPELTYSPKLPWSDVRDGSGPVMPDVMRFSDSDLNSRMECLSGDLSSPVLAFYSPKDEKAWILRFPEFCDGWENGICLEEDLEKGRLKVSILFPGVRATRYTHMRTGVESPDRGRPIQKGEVMEGWVLLREEPCSSVAELYNLVFRQRAPVPDTVNASIPSSRAFDLIAEKYNRDAWREQWNLYSSGADLFSESEPHPFQNGWCGGVPALWSLWADGDALSKERSWRSFEHLTTAGVSPSGLFYSKFGEEGWGTDCWNHTQTPERLNWHLIRREGDILLASLRMLMRLQFEGGSVPDASLAKLRLCLDAVASIWEKNDDFGQWLDQDSTAIEWPGTACAGALPGALALASRYLNSERYLHVAEAAMRHYTKHFLEAGLCYGGVGDALSVPDSESVEALLESAMCLHAVTGDAEWLHSAELAAHQFATWVMDYDYPFPADSEFGRLGLGTVGTVFANVQNKHSAPGICTHSGQGLLRLYRATGNEAFLDLLYAVAGAIPQFVSREDRPIHDPSGKAMPSGWINERVNTSDWDYNRGGIFYGSCWCEIAQLLSFTELPGLYVDLDTGKYWTMEPIKVRVTGQQIEVTNLSAWPARIKLLAERETDREEALPLDGFSGPIVEVAAGSTSQYPCP